MKPISKYALVKFCRMHFLHRWVWNMEMLFQNCF